MATTYDFQIISQTDVPGISLVVAQNEDAFRYLVDEVHYHILSDGSAPLFTESVGDFISDAGHAHLSCTYV